MFFVLNLERHPRECFKAAFARVFLHLGVSLEVRPQVGSICEGPMTLVALEWFLASVRSDVALEEPGPTEGLAANLALAGERVGAHVHLERAHGLILLTTILAAVIVVLVSDYLEWLGLEEGGLLLLLRRGVLLDFGRLLVWRQGALVDLRPQVDGRSISGGFEAQVKGLHLLLLLLALVVEDVMLEDVALEFAVLLVEGMCVGAVEAQLGAEVERLLLLLLEVQLLLLVSLLLVVQVI